MKLADDYDFAVSRRGTKTHIVDFDGGPSALILGSDNYDTDTHRRAVCGVISEMSPTDEPDDEDDYCYACARTGNARGAIVDPAPFDPDELSDSRRKDSKNV
jgi:hypothetical protein